MKERIRVLEERDSNHAETLKNAISKAGDVLRTAYRRDNAPFSLKRYYKP